LNQKPLLVLGATGYIGSRLVPLLLKHGYQVRVGYRSAKKLNSRIWSKHPRVFPYKLNVFDKNSLEKAMEGVSIVYYLVHSMESSVKDFVEKDKIAAQNTVLVAERKKIERIIYLGGLGEDLEGKKLSTHLKSRIEVSQVLNACSIPVTTLRAAIIIGTGSAAFEMMRYLADRLPAMITPRWLRTKNQPIAVENVLTYLVQVLNFPETTGETYDIGGPDIITYKQFIESYVELARLPRRVIVPIPIFSPQISSYWIKFITGLPSSLARPLIIGMKNEVIVNDTRIQKLIPQKLLGHKEAIYKALNPNQYRQILPYNRNVHIPPEWCHPGDNEWSGGLIFQNHRSIIIDSPKKELVATISKILSQKRNILYFHIYYGFGSLIDNLFRGKLKFPKDVFRIIKRREKNNVIFLANNNFPGKTYLTYMLEKRGENTIRLHQIFRIIPKGISGTVYWYLGKLFFYYFSYVLLSKVAESLQGAKTYENMKLESFSKPYVQMMK
jgi:uncharacterized protein YbjT (DUF2867 family)